MGGEQTQARLESRLGRLHPVGSEERQRRPEQRRGQLAPVGVPILSFAVHFPGKLDELAQVRFGHVGLAFLQRDAGERSEHPGRLRPARHQPQI